MPRRSSTRCQQCVYDRGASERPHFFVSLQSGDYNGAVSPLKAYARELKPGGEYASPVPGSYVQAELVQELKTAYQKMPKDMQEQFDAAVAAAKQENPNAWVSNPNFKKRTVLAGEP
jgi:hypothetical protein